MRTTLLTFLTILCLGIVIKMNAQNSMGVGTNSPNQNAVLELVSPNNNQGFLVPRMTTSQRTDPDFEGNLNVGDIGLLIFDTDESKFYFWDGEAWAEQTNGSIPIQMTNTGSIPRWDGSNLVDGSITDDGSNASVINNLLVGGNLTVSGTLEGDGSSLTGVGLQLPFSQNSTLSGPLFDLVHEGGGITFQVENSSAIPGDYVIKGKSTGNSIAGYFINDNVNATNQALYAHTRGSGASFVALGLGIGPAARLSNQSSAVNTANVLEVENQDEGGAAVFLISNIANTSNAVTINNQGTGQALNIVSGNVNINDSISASYFQGDGGGLTGVIANPGINSVGSAEIIDNEITDIDISDVSAGKVRILDDLPGSIISSNTDLITGLSELETAVEAASANTLPEGNILIGDSDNTAAPRVITGDISFSNTGAATVDSVGGLAAAEIAGVANVVNSNPAIDLDSTNDVSLTTPLQSGDISGSFSSGFVVDTVGGLSSQIIVTVVDLVNSNPNIDLDNTDDVTLTTIPTPADISGDFSSGFLVDSVGGVASEDIALSIQQIGINTSEIANNTAALSTAVLEADLDADSTFLKGLIDVNTTDIANNTAAISTAVLEADLDADSTFLKGLIDTNTADIATNTTDIANNTAALSTAVLEADLDADSTFLKGLIDVNTTNIANNTAAISTAVLEADLDADSIFLKGLIDVNTTNIANNTAAISTAVLEADLDADSTFLKGLIDTNTADIATNSGKITSDSTFLKGLIDTNITDISTNITDIANNTAAISTAVLEADLDADSTFLKGLIDTNTSDIASNSVKITSDSTFLKGLIDNNATDIANTDLNTILVAGNDALGQSLLNVDSMSAAKLTVGGGDFTVNGTGNVGAASINTQNVIFNPGANSINLGAETQTSNVSLTIPDLGGVNDTIALRSEIISTNVTNLNTDINFQVGSNRTIKPLDNPSGNGDTLTIQGGGSNGGGGIAGDLKLSGGDGIDTGGSLFLAGGAGTATPGNIEINTPASANAAGDILLSTAGPGNGDGGTISLITGDGNGGTGSGGEVVIATGSGSVTGDNGGNIILNPGTGVGGGVDGRVGIGTTTPSAKLDVVGEILADSISFVEGVEAKLKVLDNTSGPGDNLRIKAGNALTGDGGDIILEPGNNGGGLDGIVQVTTNLNVNDTVFASAFVGDGSNLTGIGGSQDIASVLAQGNDALGDSLIGLDVLEVNSINTLSDMNADSIFNNYINLSGNSIILDGPVGFITADSVSATTYFGDGSNLTGIGGSQDIASVLAQGNDALGDSLIGLDVLEVNSINTLSDMNADSIFNNYINLSGNSIILDGPVGFITADSVSATTYFGDGSNLTGITSTQNLTSVLGFGNDAGFQNIIGVDSLIAENISLNSGVSTAIVAASTINPAATFDQSSPAPGEDVVQFLDQGIPVARVSDEGDFFGRNIGLTDTLFTTIVNAQKVSADTLEAVSFQGDSIKLFGGGGQVAIKPGFQGGDASLVIPDLGGVNDTIALRSEINAAQNLSEVLTIGNDAAGQDLINVDSLSVAVIEADTIGSINIFTAGLDNGFGNITSVDTLFAQDVVINGSGTDIQLTTAAQGGPANLVIPDLGGVNDTIALRSEIVASFQDLGSVLSINNDAGFQNIIGIDTLFAEAGNFNSDTSTALTAASTQNPAATFDQSNAAPGEDVVQFLDQGGLVASVTDEGDFFGRRVNLSDTAFAAAFVGDGSLLTGVGGSSDLSTVLSNGNDAAFQAIRNVDSLDATVIDVFGNITTTDSVIAPTVDAIIVITDTLDAITVITDSVLLFNGGGDLAIKSDFQTGSNSLVVPDLGGVDDTLALLSDIAGASPWIGSPDISYTTGNVGIGTTTPPTELFVYGTADDAKTIAIDAQGTTANQLAALNLLTLGDGSNPINNAATNGWSVFAFGNAFTNAQRQNDLTFSYFQGVTESASILHLDNTGRIGIGTGDPVVSLDINATDAIRLPVGDTAERPVAPADGMIRYSTEVGSEGFEGYSQGTWDPLGGISSLTNLDSDITFDGVIARTIEVIDATAAPGGNLTLSAGDGGGAGNPGGTFSLNGGSAGGSSDASGGGIFMNGGAGDGLGVGGPLDLSAGAGFAGATGGDAALAAGTSFGGAGDGGNVTVSAGNASGGSGTGGDINLTPGTGSTADGIVSVNASTGLVLPAGATGDRPATAVNGTIRYNIDLGQFEGYDGAWGPLGGSSDLSTVLSNGNDAAFQAIRNVDSLDATVIDVFGNITTTDSVIAPTVDAITVITDTLDAITVITDSVLLFNGGGDLAIKSDFQTGSNSLVVPDLGGVDDTLALRSEVLNLPGGQDGNNNIFVGQGTGGNLSFGTGQENALFGIQAGSGIQNGNRNVVMGAFTAPSLFDGSENIVLGNEAGLNMTSASRNVFLGDSAGRNSDSQDNVYIGNAAGITDGTGTGNTLIGSGADVGSTAGANATAVGANAIAFSLGTAIGANAQVSANDGIAIGVGAIADASNSVAIGTNTLANNNNSIVLGDGTNNNFNVGIGTNNPQGTLDVNLGTGANSVFFRANNNQSFGFFDLNQSGTGDAAMRFNVLSSITTIGIDNSDGDNFKINRGSLLTAGEADFSIAPNGNVGIGTINSLTKLQVVDSLASNALVLIQNKSVDNFADGVEINIQATTPGTNNDFILFTSDVTRNVIGRIQGNGAGVNFNQTSDRRLKQDIVDLDGALGIIEMLKPREYAYKVAPEIRKTGFIAQELYKTFPEVVSGTPDGDVKKNPMMVNYSGLTPILTAGVQELLDKIKDLERVVEDQKHTIDKLSAENKSKVDQLGKLESDMKLIKDMLGISGQAENK